MRIQNLKAPHEQAAAPSPVTPADPLPGTPVANDARPTNMVAAIEASGPVAERQAAEIALLKARVQHLELVVETARALMGANQERLLRRLHELPRELVELSAQLRRIDPTASC